MAMNARKAQFKRRKMDSKPRFNRRPSRRSFPRKMARISNKGEQLVGGWARGGVLPKSSAVRLQYYDSNSQALSGSSNLQIWRHRVDSVFKPDIINTGHQPRGMDQWAGLYGLHRVKKVEVTYTHTFAGATQLESEDLDAQMLIRYSVRTTGGNPSLTETIEDLYEDKMDRIRRITVRQGQNIVVRDKFTIDPLGLVRAASSRNLTRGADGWGTVTASPSWESGAAPFISCQLFRVTSAAFTPVEFQSEIRMVYEIEMKDPIEIARST